MDNEHQIFISYPDNNKDIVENFRDNLKLYGVNAWVYSRDKTLQQNLWEEIEGKIILCKVFIYVVSNHSDGADGQKKELDYFLSKQTNQNISKKIFPVFVDEVALSELPECIRNINGLFLNAFNVKTCAFQTADLFFPEKFTEYNKLQWKYPKPGQLLQVCRTNKYIEDELDIGDILYFRRISPMGLFECYVPKIKGRFWICPSNVCISSEIDEDNSYEKNNVPEKFRIDAIIEAEKQYFKIKT